MQGGARSQNPGDRRPQGRLESLDLETPGISYHPTHKSHESHKSRSLPTRKRRCVPSTYQYTQKAPSWLLDSGSWLLPLELGPPETNKRWQRLEKTSNFSAPQSVLEIAIGLYEDGRA